MSLSIYNTLSREIEPFVPLEQGHVRMYVCGMTVYDLCHLGHARAMVAFDVVQRWLKCSGLRVTYVRNITDIDDKIIQRSLQNNESMRTLTDRMVAALHRDADTLGIERPSYEPRATDHVPAMLALIQTLEHKGLAYRDPHGDVNFAVRKFAGYGRLSGKSPDELRAGERVAVSDRKDDPLDFALWKAARPDEPPDAKWDSPYGLGRPGWHMSAQPCVLRCWGKRWIFTAEELTCSFLTTTTRSRKVRGPAVGLWHSFGCTTVLSPWTTKKCPKAWATF